MTTLARFIGYYTIPAGMQFQIARGEGGDTSTYTISLDNSGSALDVWPSGDSSTATDGTGDLIERIEDKVQAAGGGTPFAAFTASISSLGIVSFSLSAGQTATLTWTGGNGATDLRDFLRLGSSTTSSITDTPSTANRSLGTRTHELGFYPQLSVVEDLYRRPVHSRQSRADAGQVWTTSYSALTDHDIAVRFPGGWRETSYKELHDLEDLYVDHLSQGKRFRFYPDVTITAAYSRLSVPYGYHLLVCDTSSLPQWQLTPSQDGWYAWFDLDFSAFEYVA